MNSRERVLAMLDGRPVDHLPFMPITMMFAADQLGVPYGKYAADHRVLADAQLHTAELFGMDYLSVISDPAREAADCGAAVQYFDDQPPALIEERALLADKHSLLKLRPPDPASGRRMQDRVQGVALLKHKAGADKIIEGWIEGPCAQAADLRGINALMLDFYDDPAFVNDLFEWVIELELKFARAQVEAGADLIGVGDAAASLAGPKFYQEFILPHEKKLVDGLHGMGAAVRLHICGNTRQLLKGMGELDCAIVDLDSMSSLAEARQAMGSEQVLLGNINPVAVLQNGSSEEVVAAIAECHRQAGARYIVGAGCEVPRRTPAQNLRALAEYAQGSKPVWPQPRDVS